MLLELMSVEEKKTFNILSIFAIAQFSTGTYNALTLPT